MFSIKSTQRKTQLTVKIDGALTVYAAEQAAKTMQQIDNLGQKLVCDLSELNELDTAGLQLLLSLAKTTRAQGGSFSISKSNAHIGELVELFALSDELGMTE